MSDSLDPMQVLAGLMGSEDREELIEKLAYFVRCYLRDYGVDVTASPRTPEEYVRLGVTDAVVGNYTPDARTLFMFFAGAIARRIDREIETLRSATEKNFTRPTR